MAASSNRQEEAALMWLGQLGSRGMEQGKEVSGRRHRPGDKPPSTWPLVPPLLPWQIMGLGDFLLPPRPREFPQVPA
jgi:hypothetical protein